jgi:uncharacterized phage protein (TIGR02218 family)
MKDISDQLTNLEQRRTRKPVDLYDFWNDSNQYYVTSADEEITYNGQTYIPTMIGRERVNRPSDLTKSTLRINIDKLQDEVKSYLVAAPLDESWVRLMKVFRNQTPREAMVIFVGTIAEVSIKGRTASLSCDGLEKYLSHLVPRLRYQRLCPLSLYSTSCGVDKESFKATATVDSISADGLTVTSTTFGGESDNYWALGWLEFEGNRRMVVSHVLNDIVLRHAIPGLEASDSVDIYAGCNKTLVDCRDKFSNLGGELDTFFGFPYMPFDNPALWT